VDILRYAARVKPVAKEQHKNPRNRVSPIRKGTITLFGAGKLASFLAPALTKAGFIITEIVARDQAGAIKRAQKLARAVRARAVRMGDTAFASEMVWLAVPDRMIRPVAESLARQPTLPSVRFAFHSSGALGSRELAPLKSVGLAVASVHPLMTFVPGSKPALSGVPFAIEGDSRAIEKARGIVRALGGESLPLAARYKAAYHTWATMTSPLLLAYLVTLERAAHQAGLSREQSRRMSLPILRETLENYARLGAADSFTGPFIRGDVETIRKHLALMKNSKIRDVYVSLARVALDALPIKNQAKLRRLLATETGNQRRRTA
jgi:predicted short-subunit dehydrogenase-like oxidoreductase (DUF2520 family)